MTTLFCFVLVVAVALFLALFLWLNALVKRSNKNDEKKGHCFYADYVSDFFGKSITVNEARGGVEHSEIGMIFSMASDLGLNSILGEDHILSVFCKNNLFDHEAFDRECIMIAAAHVEKYGPDKRITYILSLK